LRFGTAEQLKSRRIVVDFRLPGFIPNSRAVCFFDVAKKNAFELACTFVIQSEMRILFHHVECELKIRTVSGFNRAFIMLPFLATPRCEAKTHSAEILRFPAGFWLRFVSNLSPHSSDVLPPTRT
jgi:hypothetical protein